MSKSCTTSRPLETFRRIYKSAVCFGKEPLFCANFFPLIAAGAGSIPIYWSQESSLTMPKPPIELNKVDTSYTATRLHFADLFRRYSSPILVTDLVKQAKSESEKFGWGTNIERPSTLSILRLTTRTRSGIALWITRIFPNIPTSTSVRLWAMFRRGRSTKLVSFVRIPNGRSTRKASHGHLRMKTKYDSVH
jgi:SacI homology domain